MVQSRPPGPPGEGFLQEHSLGAAEALAKATQIKERMDQRNPQIERADTWWSFVLREGRVIKDSPVAFSGCVLIAAIGLAVAFNYLYEFQVANQKSTIERQNAELGEWQRKLGGASPDEALKKIAGNTIPSQATAEAAKKQSEEISKLNSKVERLQQQNIQKDEQIADLISKQSRKVNVLGTTTTKNSDGTFTIVREIVVISHYTPNYLFITVKAKGVSSVDVNNGELITPKSERPSLDEWVVRVTNPVGNYKITVLGPASGADITYRFE